MLAAFDNANANGVDQDVVRRQVFGQALGQGNAGGPGDGSGHGRRAGGASAQVGDIDDAPAADFPHLRNNPADQPHRAPYFQVKIILPIGIADLLKGLGHGDAGIVDQDVHPAEVIQGGLGHPVGAVGMGHIGGHRQHHALGGRANILGGGVQFFRAAGHDDHPRALGGHALGGGFANALAAAGDDGYFIGKTQVHNENSLQNPGRRGTVSLTEAGGISGGIGPYCPAGRHYSISRRDSGGWGNCGRFRSAASYPPTLYRGGQNLYNGRQEYPPIRDKELV